MKAKYHVRMILLLAAVGAALGAPFASKGQTADETVITLLDYFKQGQQLAKRYLQDKAPLLQAESSVVRIHINYNKTANSFQTDWGTGCLVKGGFVVTAGHCLDVLDARSDADINILLTNGEQLSASLFMRQKKSEGRTLANDWALLRIDKHSEMGLTFGTRTPNSTVVVMGFPGRIGFNPRGEPEFDNAAIARPLNPAMLVCKVSAVSDRTITPIAGSIPIGGMSGAPVIDFAGNIVGIQAAVSENETGKSTIDVAFADAAMEAVRKTIRLPK